VHFGLNENGDGEEVMCESKSLHINASGTLLQSQWQGNDRLFYSCSELKTSYSWSQEFLVTTDQWWL